MDIELTKVSVTKKQLSGEWKFEKCQSMEIVRYETDEDGNEIGYSADGRVISFIGVEAIEEITKVLIEEIENGRNKS